MTLTRKLVVTLLALPVVYTVFYPSPMSTLISALSMLAIVYFRHF
jgi:hypothetical protein